MNIKSIPIMVGKPDQDEFEAAIKSVSEAVHIERQQILGRRVSDDACSARIGLVSAMIDSGWSCDGVSAATGFKRSRVQYLQSLGAVRMKCNNEKVLRTAYNAAILAIANHRKTTGKPDLSVRVEVPPKVVPSLSLVLSGNHSLTFDITPPELLCHKAIELVSYVTGVSREAILGRSRLRYIVGCRWAAIWLVSKASGASSVAVAKQFNLDHSAVLYAIKSVENRREKNKQYAQLLDNLLDTLTKPTTKTINNSNQK